ncbi:rRNA processing protein Ipi1 [Lindgomyces ingoldianus]|uniref:rRNA processing protein Ipi1 n=1 Tax=Lindgomyces ingoldianus TaxID=673940 RepID=A0ACB6QIC4_9PLEO|nr:rRNA processing protein Ipi1 [Lindgomyces ingoldianus]KAF2465891.1 rRNA processing protein Ipi1 [Lindgomyces ingoldianus]
MGGSSAKRKKEKKKDFQKPKLKVGKAKPKAANFTDTSFKAKSIVLTQQSLSANAPSVVAQCSHHLSMLAHKSDSQRRDSLAYLTTAITNTPAGAPLPQPTSIILPAVQRLILDGSNAVRQQLLKLLQSLPKNDIASYSDQLLLHTRAGMTHIATEIRTFALDVLEWLLGVAGDEVVSGVGGWVKMLKCFIGLLGWQNETSGKWSAPKSFGKSGGDAKIMVKQMNALAAFLRAGLVPSQTEEPIDVGGTTFPLWQCEHHMVSERSNTFVHLNLFGAPRDEEAEMYEDREDRQRVFHDKAEAAIVAGLDQVTKGGGELGRAAAQLRKVVREGMSDFRSD